MRSGHYITNYEQAIALTTSRSVLAWLAILIVGVSLVPAVIHSPYLTSLLTRCFIFSIGSIGLTLLTGSAGLISLGYSAFAAIGGYTTAILVAKYHWPVEAAIVAAGVGSAVISLVVGVPSLRLKGLYLAITTLAFVFIVNHVILYGGTITNGSRGILLPNVKLFGFGMASSKNLYWFTLIVLIVAVFAALNILRTSVGRAWIAIRDHDIAAGAMGIDIARYKLLAFVVSSFFIGISGALLCLELRAVNVDVFELLLSIEVLAMILLGGLGSVPGAIVGTVFLTLLPDAIAAGTDLFGASTRQMVSSNVYQLREIVYGITIILVLRFEPRGLIAVWANTRKFWTSWPLSIAR
jgi:branched-chain amino acid transport system permease protein